MFEIKGKVNTALCFAKVVEDEAIEQIRRMCDYEMTAGDISLCGIGHSHGFLATTDCQLIVVGSKNLPR